MIAVDQPKSFQVLEDCPVGPRCRVRGSVVPRLVRGIFEGCRLGAVLGDLRPDIWHPCLHRLCSVGNASNERENRTANFEKCVVRTADVHPFLRRPLGHLWIGPCVFGELRRVPDDVWVAGFFTVPAHRRLRSCRSDSRALQDVFFMSSTTRQVTRVL